MGADIDRACGQLSQKHKQQKETAVPVVPDIEDAAAVPRKKVDAIDTTRKVPTPTNRGLGDWVETLAVATALSACWFVVATSRYIQRKR